jgi:virginiamycin B lyase
MAPLRTSRALIGLLLAGQSLGACAGPVPAPVSTSASGGPSAPPSESSRPSPIGAPPSSSAALAAPSPSAGPSLDPYPGIKIAKIDARIVELSREAGYLGVTADAVWTPTPGGLNRIDPSTLAVDIVNDMPGFGLDATSEAIWVTADETATRLDPLSHQPTAVVKLARSPNALSMFGGSVWVAQHRGGTVTRLAEPSGSVRAEIAIGPSGPAGPQGVLATTAAVWVGIPNSSSVVRVDPATNKLVATIPTGVSPCGGIAAGPNAIWVSTCYDDHFAIRIDPRTNKNVAEIDLGGNNGGAVVIGGYPWFPVANRVVRVNPDTNRVDRVVEFAADKFLGFGSVVGFDALWVGSVDPGRIARIPLAALQP